MKALKGTYDGEKVHLEGGEELPKGSKFIVILLEDEIAEWSEISSRSLNRAYEKQEPEYSISEVKEPNQDYESR